MISINPINQRQQQVESDDEQQANIISEHIRNCVRNEKETDKSFKTLLKAPLYDTDNIHSLKGSLYEIAKWVRKYVFIQFILCFYLRSKTCGRC